MELFFKLINFLFSGKSTEPEDKRSEIITKAISMPTIDWTNPKEKLTLHFSVKDAIWLPSWGRLANDQELTEEIKANLIKLFNKMEEIRVVLGNVPINVHCTFRPEAYNRLIGGATHSAHMSGLACDWDATGMACDHSRGILEPLLESLNIRMEKKPGSNWVHTAIDWVSGNTRYFIP